MATKRKRRILEKGDHVVTAWCETHAGPGWSNFCVHLVIKNMLGEYREETIQPREMSSDLRILFPVAGTAHESLMRALEKHLAEGKGRV